VKGRVQQKAGFNKEIWYTTGRIFGISAVISIFVVVAAWLMEAHFNLA
jgi:preprotein translocase subunit SecE